MLEWLKTLYRNPEAEADPREWATTALLHFLLGIAAALVLSAVLGPLWGAVAASLAYAAFWEGPQAVRSGLWWDCILDWCMWTLGAISSLAIHALGPWLAALIIIAVGFEVRT